LTYNPNVPIPDTESAPALTAPVIN
jgi:hypothetical protein